MLITRLISYIDHLLVDMFVAWRYHESTALCPLDSKCILWLHDMPDSSNTWDTSHLDAIFVVSSFHATALPSHTLSRQVITPNGILVPTIETDTDDRDLYPGTATKFIYGSSPVRGLQTILDSWQEIRTALPTATLTVYYGFPAALVKSLIKNNGKARYFKWQDEMNRLLTQPGIFNIGMVNSEELAAGYAAADFVLYPTIYPVSYSYSVTLTRHVL